MATSTKYSKRFNSFIKLFHVSSPVACSTKKTESVHHFSCELYLWRLLRGPIKKSLLPVTERAKNMTTFLK